MGAARTLNVLFIEDVIELTKCSERHIREQVRIGALRAHKPGKRLLFYAEDVEKWIKRKATS